MTEIQRVMWKFFNFQQRTAAYFLEFFGRNTENIEKKAEEVTDVEVRIAKTMQGKKM